MDSCRPRRSSCRSTVKGDRLSLKELVVRFRREHAGKLEEELQFFQTLPSIDIVIEHIATATDGDGRCFDHQFRILRAARPKARAILTRSAEKLRDCSSFHQLHSLLDELLSPIFGLGSLYVYDSALRLGAFLGLTPKFVYLHAGTRKGARVLGLGAGREYLETRELPAPLQILTADQIESFLCTYRALF